MVVLDETSSQKAFPNVTLVRPVPMPNLPPPPAYFTSQEQANGFLPPFSGQLHRQGKRAVPLKLSTLPAHILLLIVYMTFPQTDGIDESRVVRQRKILFWLEYYARLTDRSLYVACMHVLRSTYLPVYESLIRPPYTSDPFPLLSDVPSYSADRQEEGPLCTLQRETKILDMFISLKVRDDVFTDATEYHLESEERYKDIFDFSQPKARLEDLVRVSGVEKGLITLRGGSMMRGKSRSAGRVEWDKLSVTFGIRQVGLVMTVPGGRRTIVQVERDGRMEKLEVAAKRLVTELEAWLGVQQW
ncbi:hypothetical protein BDV98DRAFT_577266 [Pterulicium gracile]|uniref:Uncharacterized protein n=1 Tax=Pterulicium gracile TaxID=1884261 RepID=A0A5C3Q0Z3_9AGAR|nr:hypothetical protein BDV98DRAFT_577266 [Pterula gracilis]